MYSIFDWNFHVIYSIGTYEYGSKHFPNKIDFISNKKFVLNQDNT